MTSRLFLYRHLPISFEESQCLLLFGPRKTGKTTLLQQQFPQALKFDLLRSEVRTDFIIRPEHFRETVLASKTKICIVDEIQKVPALLNEVHWLLENSDHQFILCGSSARKLKRGASNLLGGRAVRLDLFPLVFPEIEKFDLDRSLQHGLLPQHYLMSKPERLIRGYIQEYLQEEIIEESELRKLESFRRFLEISALMNGELLNYANVGRDCGVSPKTVREYYQILTDSLLGFSLEPWTQIRSRKLIETEKYYLFDPAIVRSLKGLSIAVAGTNEYGNLFETLMIGQIRAYLSYEQKYIKMRYWRTTSGFEVDLILSPVTGPMSVAIEFKSSDHLRQEDFRGILAFSEEYPKTRKILVCREKVARTRSDGIEIMPWDQFLTNLWSGKVV